MALIIRVISVLLALTVSVVAAWADIYRYVDDDGVSCYTDSPLNRKAERIIRTGPAETGKNVRNANAQPGKKYREDFHGIVSDKASKYAVEPSLVHAVIKAESDGDPSAVSRKGAMGLMQLMPTTASDLSVRNPFDPEENIDGGTRYLKYLIDKFKGDLTLALAAYNAGPKAVEKRGAVPEISETKQYVRKVLSLYSGNTHHPVSAPSLPAVERIFKITSDDGVILFTNSPLYNKNPRF